MLTRRVSCADPLQSAMLGSLPSLQNEDTYELCSIASSNETADDLIGPGRMLGRAYGFFGRKIENALSNAAEQLGYGPRVTAVKIRRLYEDESIPASTRNKQLRRKCKRLGRYVR